MSTETLSPDSVTGRTRLQFFRSRLSLVNPLWYGLATLTAITGYYVLSGSRYLFTYNLCLFAVFGAVALNLLMGTAGLVSIGNAAFLAVGAFSAMFFLRVGLAFPLDVVAASLTAAVAGVIIGLPALRLRGLHLALATMAGFFIVYYLASEYQSKAKGIGTGGFLISPLYQSKGLDGSQVYWAWTLLVLVGALIVGTSRISDGRSGRAWRMIRDHETVAPTLGIAVVRYKVWAFAISSAMIGFEGALTAHFTGSVTAETFTFGLAVAYVAMVLIGGIDSIAGAVIGAGVVTALPVFVPKVISAIIGADAASRQGPALATILYGVMVIVFITSSHQGIVGLVKDLRNKIGGMVSGADRDKNEVPR